MRIVIFPSTFYGANCCVLLPDGAQQALVVDPSHGVADQVKHFLDDNKVQVGAILATHGHPDHIWDVAEMASWGTDVPLYIPGPDRHRLADPLSFILDAPDLSDIGPWCEPKVVEDMPLQSTQLVPGVWLQMVPAPGHTEGSAIFLGECDIHVSTASGMTLMDSDTPVPWALSGDVIFQGSVGRTDLPGGDEVQMRHTLRTLSNVIDPETWLIPGHGGITRWQRELATNPYVNRARHIG